MLNLLSSLHVGFRSHVHHLLWSKVLRSILDFWETSLVFYDKPDSTILPRGCIFSPPPMIPYETKSNAATLLQATCSKTMSNAPTLLQASCSIP